MQQAPMPPQAQGAPQQSAQGPSAGQVLQEMIIQVDQSMSKIAQVIAQANPQAGQALMKVNEEFRQVISQIMQGGGSSQSQQQPASPMASPETHGKPSMPAY